MDAKSLIDNYIDGATLLRYYNFRNINDKHEVIRACCKLHEGNEESAFAYNISTNEWFCHTGDCGGGDAYEIVKRLENCSYPKAIIKMAEIFNVNIDNLKLTTIKTSNQKEKDEWFSLMKKISDKSTLTPFISPELDIKPIKKFRHYNIGTLEYFGAFYTESYPIKRSDETYYDLKKRIVIPITFKKQLIGMALRRTRINDIQKWSNQGFDSGCILYNYDSCLEYLVSTGIDEVICVEGIFDVWSCWQQGIYNVVATFGAHITDIQIELLQSMCSTLILAYDNDNAGKANTKKVILALKHKFDLYVLQFKEGEDPGSDSDLTRTLNDKIYYTQWREECCKNDN
jgi:DNA primase